MKVRGRREVTEYLDVKIDVTDVLEEVYNRSKPSRLEYIKDGFWYVIDRVNHRGEPEFKKDREATPEEIELRESYYTLRSWIQRNQHLMK